MFIKVADRELQPTDDDGRSAGARGRRSCSCCSRRARASGRRPRELRAARRPARSRSGSSTAALPVHADRLGREAHRLGRGRDRERVDADLRRADRDPVPARASGPRACGSSGSCSGSWAWACWSACIPSGGWLARGRDAGGRRRVGRATRSASLWGQHLVSDESPLVLSTAAIHRRRDRAAAVRARASCRPSFPSWKAIGCVVALGVLGTAIGAAALLPAAADGRLLAREPRHLPDARRRALLRRRCCSTSRSRPRSSSGSS